MLKKLLFIILSFLLTPAEAPALSFSQHTDLVDLKIIPEYKSITAQTKELTILAEINVKTDWHLYWDNPGDTGAPTTLTFYDTPYYKETAATHTAPQKSVFENIITSYIYPQKLYFKNTFSLQNLTDVKRLPFNLVLSYTACKESCQPEKITLNFALPLSDIAEKNPTYLSAVVNAEETFPAKLNATASFDKTELNLELQMQNLSDCQEPEFVSLHPKTDPLADLPVTTLSRHNRLKVDFNADNLPPDFKGVLLCPGFAYYLDPQPLATPAQPQSSAPTTPAKTGSLAYYLLIAFIAGLILNLMPCVLPVLGLKALTLVNKRQTASPVSALLYLTGVLCSFLLLSGVLFYLRTIGTELGWGFQLQSPAFNIFLLLLFFLIFLNLIDKLPIPEFFTDKLSRLSEGKSFLTGFFAVIIACPCTGPFMGAALGYALTQPAVVYFGIFLSLGLGYALPYTLIELFPRFFLKRLPKPGHWLITLKRVLALPILLTCFWLGWVIFNQLKPQSRPAEIAWQPYSPQAVAEALQQKQAVFINFTAKWCLVCLLNDKTTLSSENFRELVKAYNIKLFKADWTNRSPAIGEALKTYNRNSIPLYVYYPSATGEPQILPQILTPELVKNSISAAE